MRRVCCRPTPRVISMGMASLIMRRYAGTKGTPPTDPTDINAAGSSSFDVDAKAAEQMRIATEMGQETFEENTTILKNIAMRGMRAFLVCMVGMIAFSLALKRKKKQLAADELVEQQDNNSEESAGMDLDDPTQRYLEEMRGLGFDVDTLEEELELERKTKQLKQQQAGSKTNSRASIQ